MPAWAALARSASSIELHGLRSSRRGRKRKPAMDTERHTDVRGDSTSSVGEAAAPLSQPHAPGTSPVRPLERTHDGDAYTLALRADYEALARENKILREELAQRRLAATRFRRLFELPLIGISIASPDRHMLDVNQKFCDMLGYSKEELTGKLVREITHPDDYGKGSQYRSQQTVISPRALPLACIGAEPQAQRRVCMASAKRLNRANAPPCVPVMAWSYGKSVVALS